MITKMKKMKCWDKIVTPMRKVWTKLSKKLGLTKNPDHVKLQQDVRTCEYEDVHVLWEMLKKSETEVAAGSSGHSRRNGSGPFSWEVFQWAKHTPLICRAG